AHRWAKTGDAKTARANDALKPEYWIFCMFSLDSSSLQASDRKPNIHGSIQSVNTAISASIA
ncbi:MAG: hypothetical protein OXJ56_05530, partial [Rhodospirillaceae bacterium]|nr:hypothetical protein [Rhodospirillaceae bacterium]